MSVKTALTFLRTSNEPRPPTDILIPIPRVRGRPPIQYRLRVHTPEAVDVARRLGIPVYLLTAETVSGLGCSMTFPAHLLVSREIDAAVESRYPRIRVIHDECVLHPRIEDLVVAMLQIDPLAARLLAIRNREFVDPARLTQRVIQEGWEGAATRVGLQELAPQLPRVGTPLPRTQLRQHDRDHIVVGLRA